MKRAPRSLPIIDKLHRGVVISCIAVTGLGMLWGCAAAYNFITVVRPLRRQEELKLLADDKELLKD